MQTNNPAEPYNYIERAFINEFEKKYPHIRISFVDNFALHNQYRYDVVKMAITGTTAPDILQSPIRNSGLLMEQGLLVPLDDYIAGWDDRIELPGRRLKDIALRPATTYRGHTYYLNNSPGPTVLLYRRDRFAEAGLTGPPRTWDELLDYCRRLTDPATGRYGLAMYGEPTPPGWRWSLFLRQAGGDYFRQDSTGRWHANLDTPAAEAAVRFYRELRAGTWVRNGDTLTGAARGITWVVDEEFRQGKAAMIFGTSYKIKDMNDPQVAAALLPAGPAGSITQLSGMLTGINAAISRERQDAAWKYISFSKSRTARRMELAMWAQRGNAVYENAAEMRAAGLERYIDESSPDRHSRLDSLALVTARPEVYGPPAAAVIYGETRSLLNRAIGPDAYSMDIRAELAALNRRIDRQLLGNIPPQEQHRRRTLTGFIVLGMGLCMLVLLGWYAYRSYAAEKSRTLPGDAVRAHTHLWAWTLMLPAVASILLWQYYPLAKGLHVAFLDHRILGGSTWVGFDNFVTAFWRPAFWRAFLNSLIYVGLTLLLGFALPVILAIMFQELPRGGGIYRTVFYLPAVISPLVVTMLWLDMYTPGPEGFLNRVMILLGLPQQTWLADPHLAMLCIVLPGVWAAAGAGSILYQAALYAVPADLYEQADIDGAGFTRKLFHVTLPALRPLIIIQLTGTVIGAFHATQRILVMGRSGPAEKTTTLGIEIFNSAFEYMQFGYATAVAWIMGGFLIGFTVFQLNLFRRVRFAVRGRG